MGNTRSKHLSHKLFNISRKQDRKKKNRPTIRYFLAQILASAGILTLIIRKKRSVSDRIIMVLIITKIGG